nr:zinc finger, CCHC-type [Tanacetum cinerariifolium]
MDYIMGNNTWVLTDLPPGCNPFSCKWVFKRKLKVDLTKEFLSLRFFMKDMGKADVILVGKLSRYTSNPGTQHWQAIQRVLKYLKKTINYKLTYTSYPSMLEGYTDVSWISNSEDNSSTREFMLGGATSKEVEWLRNLILKISLWSKPIALISICCNNVATLAKAYSQMYNRKSTHLGVRHSMIRELVMNGVISTEFIRSQQTY